MRHQKFELYFLSILYNRAWTKFLSGCPRDYHSPMKSNRALVGNPGKCYFSHASFVTVTSEYRVKRAIRKTWTGTLANSADADQGLYCLLKLQEVK